MKIIALIFLLLIQYFSLYSQGFNQSASCHDNIACKPDWCDQRRSVIQIEKFKNNEYERSGTAFLIANEKADGTPYILTANHIFDENRDGTLSVEEINLIQTARFVFNYQFNSCNSSNVGSEPSRSDFIIGATYVSSVSTQEFGGTGTGGVDFMLIKLNSRIPANFNVFYSGFSISEDKPNNITMIHHPWGDVKKIAFENKKPTTGQDAVWGIKKWHEGGAEQGSSGAPWYNQDKLIVGIQTSTGTNVCTNKKQNSSAGRFYLAYDNISNNNNQLKYWLSPNKNENIGGYDACRTYIYIENANDLHTSANINVATNPSTFASRSYDGVYTSSGAIITGDNVTIQSGTSVSFYGQMVVMKPGFTSVMGSNFKANPTPCLYGCGNGKSTVETNNDEEIVEEVETFDDEIVINVDKSNEVFPNPFSTQLTIEVAENYVGGELSIYDVMGLLVTTIKLTKNQLTLDDFNQYASGLYTLVFSKNEYFETQKIVKQ
jgi:hypothetical protein